MIIQLALEEERAVRSVFVVAYVKFGQTRLMFLPKEDIPLAWEGKPLRWLGRDTLDDGRVDRLGFDPDLAWYDKVTRIVVLAMTEQAYAVSATYTVENIYGTGDRRDCEDPRPGITLRDIPVQTGFTLLVDYNTVGDNSQQVEGPSFATFAEAQASLGLPSALAA